MGKRDKISIFSDNWIPNSSNLCLATSGCHFTLNQIVELINNETKEWKKELIIEIFGEAKVERILHVPLVVVPHEDELV